MISENTIKKQLPIVIDTYCKLFGEEYRNIITTRLNNLQYFIYDNITNSSDFTGFESYYDFLLSCKQKELSIKFLDLIGVDTSKNQGQSFAYELDNSLYDLIDNYIGGYSALEIMGNDNICGALSFKSENSESRESRANFLNFLRNFSTPTISIDTLDDFYQTEEYKLLRPKIDSFIRNYESILVEYERYKDSLEPYRKCVLDEENAIKNIYENKRKEFLKKTYSMLPLKLKMQMAKNKLTITDILDNNSILEEKSNIEFFSKSDNMKLEDPNTDEYTKDEIKNFRKQYFLSMGIDINLDEDNYDDIIKMPSVKRIIPSEETIDKISKLKAEKLQQAKNEYYVEKYNLSQYSPALRNNICNNMINKLVCIFSYSSFSTKVFSSFLFFTTRNGEEGTLDCLLLHEFCHQIELSLLDSKEIGGFDITDSKDKLEYNPYSKEYRKYERLNENITDIFAIDALKILRNNNIYMLEDEKISKDIDDLEDHNTSRITKKLLRPFVYKYKKQIVKARISGNMNELFAEIGEENFEDLNDSINKLDNLIAITGIDISDLDNLENTSNSYLLNFSIELDRLNRIFTNIDNYKINQKSTYKEETIQHESSQFIKDDSER